jgi:hypothetical protein
MSEKRRGRKPGVALLGVAPNYIEAMMWKDMLEQQSIPCMVRDGSPANVELGGGFAGLGALPGGGQLQVYVPASALQKSREILGPALASPRNQAPKPLTKTVSAIWLAWILGPIILSGLVVAVLIALGAI